MRQEDVHFRGAAIECRVYAEDAENRFMPSPGKITGLRLPGGPGIRDDSGIYEGFEVPIFYDPLLSKLAAWGNTREEALHRIAQALEEYQVRGIKTTIPFYQRLIRHPDFIRGNVTTAFIDQFLASEAAMFPETMDIAIVAAAVHEFRNQQKAAATNASGPRKSSAWKETGWKDGFRS